MGGGEVTLYTPGCYLFIKRPVIVESPRAGQISRGTKGVRSKVSKRGFFYILHIKLPLFIKDTLRKKTFYIYFDKIKNLIELFTMLIY